MLENPILVINSERLSNVCKVGDRQRRVKNIDLMHRLADLYTICQDEAWNVLVMKGYDVGIKSGPNACKKGPYQPHWKRSKYAYCPQYYLSTLFKMIFFLINAWFNLTKKIRYSFLFACHKNDNNTTDSTNITGEKKLL